MRALKLYVSGAFESVDVDPHRLHTYIDAQMPERVCVMRTDSMNLCLVVDESGRYSAKRDNPVASDLYGYQHHGVPVVGDVLVVAEAMTLGGPDFVDCDHDTLMDMVRETLRVKGAALPE